MISPGALRGLEKISRFRKGGLWEFLGANLADQKISRNFLDFF